MDGGRLSTIRCSMAAAARRSRCACSRWPHCAAISQRRDSREFALPTSLAKRRALPGPTRRRFRSSHTRERPPMTATMPLLPDTPEGAAIRDAFLADERATLVALASQITQIDADAAAIGAQARAWVEAVRSERQTQGGIESFLQQYDLSTPEGVLLMCVAEALIRDKLSRGDWDRHLGASDSLLVNASTLGTDADRQADAHRAGRRARS